MSIFLFSSDEPLGVIHNPKIMEAWDGGRCSIYCTPLEDVIDSSASFYAGRHLPTEFNTNSYRYIYLNDYMCSVGLDCS